MSMNQQETFDWLVSENNRLREENERLIEAGERFKKAWASARETVAPMVEDALQADRTPPKNIRFSR